MWAPNDVLEKFRVAREKLEPVLHCKYEENWSFVEVASPVLRHAKGEKV